MELLSVPQYIFYIVNRFVGLLASSCLSVPLEQLGSHWTDFHEILYLSTFEKSVERLEV